MIIYAVTAGGPQGYQVTARQSALVGDFGSRAEAEAFAHSMRQIDAGVTTRSHLSCRELREAAQRLRTRGRQLRQFSDEARQRSAGLRKNAQASRQKADDLRSFALSAGSFHAHR
jgi:hypothetical protein